MSLPGSVCANSGACAERCGSFQHPTRSHLVTWSFIPSRLHLEVLVMYTMGLLGVQEFVSNASGSASRKYNMTRRRSSRFVIDFVVFPALYRSRKSQDFCREAVIWKRMVHPNVVPLLGITISQRPQLISNWMSGGDLSKYIKKNPGTDRLGLVGAPLVGYITHLLLSPALRRC